jgi:hypothetical protein
VVLPRRHVVQHTPDFAWLLGRQGAWDCLARLGRRIWTLAPTLPEGKQPEMLTAEAIQALLKK